MHSKHIKIDKNQQIEKLKKISPHLFLVFFFGFFFFFVCFSLYHYAHSLASTTGFIELLLSPKHPVKYNRDVVSNWLPIFRPNKKKLHPGDWTAKDLQCNLKVFKHSVATLLQEFMVHSRLITYYPCVYTSPIRQWRCQFRPKFESASS